MIRSENIETVSQVPVSRPLGDLECPCQTLAVAGWGCASECFKRSRMASIRLSSKGRWSTKHHSLHLQVAESCFGTPAFERYFKEIRS